MRLSPQQAQTITQSVHHHLGDSARTWLFGSRLHDEKKGGDIDLYVEAGPHSLMHEVRCKLQLTEALDMPVDLIVRSSGDSTPIARIAKGEGIPL